ncbi:MAG TPA: vitamin K epoxide reductase family protein [Burkholderiales bacterium]|nr:vitamin K epoxide reductase family protein [Burkholderiales bacterium]
MSDFQHARNHSGTAITVMLALALIGIADAFYDSYAIYNGQLLWCPPPIDGCNTVAASPYARIFGVPLGYLGLAFYLAMLALATWLRFDPLSRGLRWVALLYAAAGLGASMYFFYVQRTYIHAFCIYCLISGVLTFLLFIAAIVHFRATRAVGARLLHGASTT